MLKIIEKIVLPEGDEERTLVASQRIKEEGLADVYLVGSEQVIREKAEAFRRKFRGSKHS